MILRQALWIVAIGLAIVLLAGRLLGSQLYRVRPADPASLLIAIGLLAGVGAFTAWLPARRTARLEPLTALRYE